MPRSFIAILLITGALLLATAIPGAFITDENNYMVTVLALRQGQLSVPGTEGLYPSQELLYFDPMGSRRPVKATPVYPATPPLYSILALPFSFFGWRGLMALNTLAFLATSIMVFAYAQRYSENPETPWIAAAAFAFGGFNLEYAQGVWPQMLSSALCFAGVLAASRVRETGCFLTAACAGLATGLLIIFMQNAFCSSELLGFEKIPNAYFEKSRTMKSKISSVKSSSISNIGLFSRIN